MGFPGNVLKEKKFCKVYFTDYTIMGGNHVGLKVMLDYGTGDQTEVPVRMPDSVSRDDVYPLAFWAALGNVTKTPMSDNATMKDFADVTDGDLRKFRSSGEQLEMVCAAMLRVATAAKIRGETISALDLIMSVGVNTDTAMKALEFFKGTSVLKVGAAPQGKHALFGQAFIDAPWYDALSQADRLAALADHL